VLHSFSGKADGGNPGGGVIRDSQGNLYGTTILGGDVSCYYPYGCGAVYKLDVTGKETVLYKFKWGKDGAFPSGSLIRDAEGNLYGTAEWGGYTGGICGSAGCGLVFKLTP